MTDNRPQCISGLHPALECAIVIESCNPAGGLASAKPPSGFREHGCCLEQATVVTSETLTTIIVTSQAFGLSLRRCLGDNHVHAEASRVTPSLAFCVSRLRPKSRTGLGSKEQSGREDNPPAAHVQRSYCGELSHRISPGLAERGDWDQFNCWQARQPMDVELLTPSVMASRCDVLPMGARLKSQKRHRADPFLGASTWGGSRSAFRTLNLRIKTEIYVSKTKPKTSWKRLAPEVKSRVHRNQRCRSAQAQIKAWLISQGVDVLQANTRNKLFRLFLERIGKFVQGVSIKQQIESLYVDAEFDLIGRSEPGFYFSPEWLCLRESVLRKYGRSCMRCNSVDHIAVDHIKPRSRFPELSLEFDNMQVLCRSCNSSKSNRDIVDYRIRLGGVAALSPEQKVDFKVSWWR